MKNWHSPLVTLVIVSVILSLVSISLMPGPTEAAPVGPAALSGGEPIILRAGRGVATFRIGPPQISPWRLQSTTFIVNYLPAGTTNRFGDNCLDWPAQAQTAFTYAANLWGALLNSSVPININACWAHLSSGVLGHSGANGFYRDFAGAPQANTWYSVALANALSGADLNGDANAEMDIAYSNSFSWYFGTDGSTPIFQYDFVSVVLHEIAHGLNFAGSMWVSGGQGSWGLEASPPYRPLAYDRFTKDGNGVSLLNTGTYPNPSAALASALTGNVGGGVFFDGTYANAANGGSRVQLYTPSTWQSGSSYSHLAESFNGTPNALMTYSLNDGEAIHNPGPVTCGILQELGWPGGCASTPNVYLPIVMNSVTQGLAVTPGFWEGDTGQEFYVSADAAQVLQFAVYVTVPFCGIIKITGDIPAAISNGSFSFSGPIYASGTFDTATSAHGTNGLDNYFSTTCQRPLTVEPWTWTAAWKNTSQPTLMSEGVVEKIIGSLEAPADVHAIPVAP